MKKLLHLILLFIAFNTCLPVRQAFSQSYTNTKQIRFFAITTASDTAATVANSGRMWYDGSTHEHRVNINGTNYSLSNSSGSSGAFWSLTDTSTLTGTTTILSNNPNQLTFGGTWTQTSNNDYHTNFNNSITSLSTGASDTLIGYKFTPSLTRGTGVGFKTAIAVDINPSFNGYSVSTEYRYGLRTTGNVLIGTSTPNTTTANRTTLELYSLSGGTSIPLAIYNENGRVITVDNVSEIFLGSTTLGPKIQPHNNGTGVQNGRGLLITTAFQPGNNAVGLNIKSADNATNSGNNYSTLLINNFTYATTASGAGDFSAIKINNTINQSGAANQPIYGIIYNPTTTSVLGAHYSFYATAGNAYFGAANNIIGTATNNNAATGNIGEYIESKIAIGSAVSLTTATPANITSISLTAGDWDVEANINYSETTATVTARTGGTTSTSATLPTDGSEVYCGVQSVVTSETNSITIPRKRFSLSGTTTIYLVANATFSAGTCSGFGIINARRIR